MDFANCRTDLPVLLLYNLDPSWPEEDAQERCEVTQQLLDALVEIGHPVQTVCVQSAELERALADFDPDEYLIFNWCEEIPGIPHSEYLVVQSLERLGFTYTGTASHALAINQNKHQTKLLLQQWNIPTPAWQIVTSACKIDWTHFPAIVKPAFEHCSYGITREAIVQSKLELVRRVRYVMEELKQPAIIEDFLDHREFHVGIIGNGDLRVLPPAEIDYSAFHDIHDRLCTYESNFDRASLAFRLTIPKLSVVLTESQRAKLEEIVIASFRATNCQDYARMDLRLKDETFYVLDVNPNADISPDTSLVKTAEMIGLSYGRLGSLLVNFAAQRHHKFRKSL